MAASPDIQRDEKKIGARFLHLRKEISVFGNLANDDDVWLINKSFDDHFAHQLWTVGY